jgi:rSAM/selenodomain-associated transferase 2
MASMCVSVVVPCLNERAVLPRTLRRLRRLMPDAELVVADGGSTDGSADLVSDLAHVVRAPCGRGAQLNSGAAVASGEVLLFVHADARLRGDPRPELVRALARKDCAAVYFTQRIAARGALYRCIEQAAHTRARRLGWILGDLGLAVRRELFLAVGGFPADPLFEDLGISRRLRRHGKFVRSAMPLLVSARRWQRRGVLRTTLRNWSLTLGYYLGVPAHRLAAHYRAVR